MQRASKPCLCELHLQASRRNLHCWWRICHLRQLPQVMCKWTYRSSAMLGMYSHRSAPKCYPWWTFQATSLEVGAHFSWKLCCSRPGLLPATSAATSLLTFSLQVCACCAGDKARTRSLHIDMHARRASARRECHWLLRERERQHWRRCQASSKGNALQNRETECSSLHLQCGCLPAWSIKQAQVASGPRHGQSWLRAERRSRQKAEARHLQPCPWRFFSSSCWRRRQWPLPVPTLV